MFGDGVLTIVFERFAFWFHGVPLQTFIYDEGHDTAIFLLQVVGELAVPPKLTW
jgi:hypothetical protein